VAAGILRIGARAGGKKQNQGGEFLHEQTPGGLEASVGGLLIRL
jgi:hypothetical protein